MRRQAEGRAKDHGDAGFVHRHTRIHSLPAEVKVVAMVAFIFTVIATPIEQFWALVPLSVADLSVTSPLSEAATVVATWVAVPAPAVVEKRSCGPALAMDQMPKKSS